jgi:hypothetical protein
MSVEIGFSSGHTLRTDEYEEPTELVKKLADKSDRHFAAGSFFHLTVEGGASVWVNPDQIAYLTRTEVFR